MTIHFNTALNTYMAADEFGVVLAIYDPAQHGSLENFRATALSLVEH